jgi:glycosyltransferase involved in cell wall biosynthesis
MGAFNLTYLGKMVKRDGAFQMVKAVRKLLAKGVAIKFNIVGCSGIGGEALKVKEFCKRDKLLRDNVIFRGRVSDSEVKSYLSKADGLIFIRADNIMAKAAFPTRLPEYLVSGKPVVAAGVGDIPAYLRDGVDAVIIFPVTIDKIAQGIERLVQMPDKGASIGISGFHQAERFFDYRTRTRQILEFAKSLQKK